MTAQAATKLSTSRGDNKTFTFTNSDFDALRELVQKQTGIALSDTKRDLVYGRLSKRLRALKLSSFTEYRKLLEANPDGEMEDFTNAITTNLTAFFRENHHFEYLTNDLVPKLMAKYKTSRRLRIWSAGCSTGEEPYSLAIALREAIPNIDSLDIRILASDIDSKVIANASKGIYSADRIEGIDAQRQERWFKRSRKPGSNLVKVSDDIRKLITFNKLNLMQEWPMRGKFDVIFCRNVVIYFDKETQQRLFDRYANILTPDGMLFIGHSETLHDITDRFHLIGKTVYEKVS